MFQEKITNSKKVINIDDVNEVITQLGEPEQMAEPEEEPKAKGPGYEEKAQKRLYRDPDDKYIAGVSGGLGAFLNIDPVWIRVAFVVFTFVYGFGPLLYIILWIVVPKAKTTAEKLEMRGEKVNISNIEKSIKEELNELKDNIKEFSEETKQHFKKKEKNKVNRDRSAQVAAGLVQVFAKAAGIILILLSFSFLLALISAIYVIPVGLHFTHGIVNFSLPDILAAFLSSVQWVNITLIAILLLVGIPVFWMLLTGIQLLFDIKTTSKYLGAITLILWLAAIGTIVISAVSGATQFTSHAETTENYQLETSQWPNLYLQVNESEIPETREGEKSMKLGNWNYTWSDTSDEVRGFPELHLRKSPNETTFIDVVKESRGSSLIEAQRNSENISYSFVQKDSLLLLDPVFFVDKKDGWRNQEVTIELYIPEDKIAVMDRNIRRYLSVRGTHNVGITEK
jgi:phage shock protein PspC (stress-responsive transcriptional regulator)